MALIVATLDPVDCLEAVLFAVFVARDQDRAIELAAEASDLSHAVGLALEIAHKLGLEDRSLLGAPRRVDIVSGGRVELSIRVTEGGLLGPAT